MCRHCRLAPSNVEELLAVRSCRHGVERALWASNERAGLQEPGGGHSSAAEDHSLPEAPHLVSHASLPLPDCPDQCLRNALMRWSHQEQAVDVGLMSVLT